MLPPHVLLRRAAGGELAWLREDLHHTDQRPLLLWYSGREAASLLRCPEAPPSSREKLKRHRANTELESHIWRAGENRPAVLHERLFSSLLPLLALAFMPHLTNDTSMSAVRFKVKKKKGAPTIFRQRPKDALPPIWCIRVCVDLLNIPAEDTAKWKLRGLNYS